MPRQAVTFSSVTVNARHGQTAKASASSRYFELDILFRNITFSSLEIKVYH